MLHKLVEPVGVEPTRIFRLKGGGPSTVALVPKNWCDRQDFNLRPQHWQCRALNKLSYYRITYKMVALRGVEPRSHG